MRLLVVDDSAMNVEFVVDALEKDGHAVAIERDGVSGRDRALAERFDLILLDIQMPGLDGVAVLRELRERGMRTPIVALSAAAMPEQIARGLAAGFDDYLVKPISLQALRDAVRRHARGDRSA